VHPSAYEFATTALTGADVEGKRVLEAGAYCYNGTARHSIEALRPARYLGTDAQPGTGVDLVCPAEKLPEAFGEGTADVLLSTEMLEHAEDWRGAVTGMVRVLAPGGLLLLTARGPGFPFHPHPGDFWRFTVEQAGAIAAACGLEVRTLMADPDPASPGVFLLARKPEQGWDGAGMAEGLAAVEPGPPR
jgi:SAM-dependent methyltransferase